MFDGGTATAGPSPWSRSGGMRVDGGEDDGHVSNSPRAPLNLPKTPRKLGRQPPVKGHKRETLYDIARRVPVSVMREYFNFSLRQAADAMSISVTSLKRLCRRHGVKRWPHRQLSGLNRTVAHLEGKQQASSDPSIAQQLHQLYSRRDVIIDQAFASDDTSSELRRDSPSRSNNEEQDVLLDSRHQERQEAPEHDEAPTPLKENPGRTIPWRQRELGTNLWPHHQPHQQLQQQTPPPPPPQQQQQQRSGDHDRGFEAFEGAPARGEEEYLTRGWGTPSRSPDDDSSDNATSVSMGLGQREFRSSLVLPSSPVTFAPEKRPEEGQARRPPQSALSRAANNAAEVTNMGTGTNPSRSHEKKVPSLPTHAAPLPQQRPRGTFETPVAKIAVLNALLLGGGPSDAPTAPGSFSSARATAGGTHPRRRRCSEGPKGGGGGEGPWGTGQNNSSSGPFPSIARLVEAGALLSGTGESDWR